MATLKNLHSKIIYEYKKIEILRNTPHIDADFLKEELVLAKQKIVELQKEFDNEYFKYN